MKPQSLEKEVRRWKDSIAIVGNGDIPDNFGDEIDRHSIVVRFNHFRLAGYEQKVGTKTTHWCINRDLKAQKNGLAELNRHVLNPKLLMPWTKKDLLLEARVASYFQGDVAILREPTSSFLDNPFFTTGFRLLFHLLLYNKPATLYGIDFLASAHYFNSQHSHGAKHHSEAIRLEKLIIIKSPLFTRRK